MFHNSPYLSGHIFKLMLGVLILLALAPTPARAHEFVVSLRAVGADRDQILADALRGFLLATTERDAHANEQSNGHLGGLDVYIIPQPESMASQFPELKSAPTRLPDIIAIIGGPQDVSAEVEGISSDAAVLRPGLLLDDNRWAGDEGQTPTNFAARYVATYGQPASQWAARGYNAARRIDAAVRPLGGVNDPSELESAFADSAGGIRW